jgi:N-acyl-L-homoserine lactone synthetase
MTVIVRTRTALLRDPELTMGMHRLRGRVFKDRLDWDVSVSDGLEIDQYDTFKPTYLLAVEQCDVVGCVRLLPVHWTQHARGYVPGVAGWPRGTESSQDLGELALLR